MFLTVDACMSQRDDACFLLLKTFANLCKSISTEQNIVFTSVIICCACLWIACDLNAMAADAVEKNKGSREAPRELEAGAALEDLKHNLK